MKRKIIIAILLIGIPAGMFLARMVLAPVTVMAQSGRDDQIASELRAELMRLYQKRYVYPPNLDGIWNDPEFITILNTSYLPADRSNAFSYQSTGDSYEFTFTNRDTVVIERGTRGAPSREVVKLGATTNASPEEPAP